VVGRGPGGDLFAAAGGEVIFLGITMVDDKNTSLTTPLRGPVVLLSARFIFWLASVQHRSHPASHYDMAGGTDLGIRLATRAIDSGDPQNVAKAGPSVKVLNLTERALTPV